MGLRASPWKRVTGVLLGQDRIVTTTLIVTPFGARQIAGAEEHVANGDLSTALQLLQEAGHLRGRLVCGLDAHRSYTITRKLTADEHERPPAELLASLLGFQEGALVGGSEPVKLPGGMHTALASCPRDIAAAVLEGLGEKPNPVRLVPLTFAYQQRAAKLKARPRKWRTEVRILLGRDGGLALLSHGGYPVASHLFDMADANDTRSLGLAILSLTTHAHEELSLPAVDGVLMHVGEEGKELVESCEGATGLKTLLAPKLATDPESASLALAWMGVRPKPGGMDLLHELLPRPRLLHRLPVRAAATLGAAALCLGWMLAGEASDVEAEASKLEKQTLANLKHAHVQLADLKKVQDKLKTEVEIAKSFVTNRLRWGDLLRELPALLPPTMVMIDFDGRDTVHFPLTGKKAKKAAADVSIKGRQVTISGEVSLDAADSSPPEVAQLTDSIRASPVFQAVLPRITGANVRLMPTVKGLSARITVYCLPPGPAGKK